MKVTDQQAVQYKEETETRELVKNLCFANNSNGNFLNKVLKSLDFSDNFSQFSSNITVENGVKITIRHRLGKKPTQVIFTSSNRVDRYEEESSNGNTVDSNFYLKSAILTAAVSTSTTLYVSNTNIFKVGDAIKIGTTTTNVKEIDAATRKIVTEQAITASQFDIVQINSDAFNVMLI